MPGATTGTSYGQTVTASGGTGPYTFAVTAGSLPAGLSLSSGGVLSGTPTALGNFSFTVTATDANSCTGSAAYTLNVACGAISLSLTETDLTCIGANDGQVTATFSGGTGPYQVQIDGGGFAAQASPFTFTGLSAASHSVDVKDANNCSATASITVNNPPALSLSLTKTDISCFGAGDGMVTATFSGGTGTLQVRIDGGLYAAQTSPFTFFSIIGFVARAEHAPIKMGG